MKQFVLILVIFTLGSSTVVSQLDIKASPINLITGDILVSAELALSEKRAIEIHADYVTTDRDNFSNPLGSEFLLRGLYKFYFIPRQGIDRLSLAPFIVWRLTGTTNVSGIVQGRRITVGGQAGYKFVLGERFVIEPSAGISLGAVRNSSFPGTITVSRDLNLFLFGNLRLNLGYRFN